MPDPIIAASAELLTIDKVLLGVLAVESLSGEQTKSLLDNLAYAEKMGWVNAAESFVAARKLRNLLVHEYMTHAALFLESLQAANKATDMLIEIVEKVRRYGGEIGAL